jgi:glyoxylase-like metal-dependent hydrolase (beta-lactamase superfamily II)
MTEVAPGIRRVEAPLGDRFNALYLFVGDDCTLLVDTGIASTPREALLPYLERERLDPRRVRYVVNTHADMDHMGGNSAVRTALPRALLCCHLLDQPLVEDVGRMIAERYGEFGPDHDIHDPAETTRWYRENADEAPVDLALTGGEQIHLGGGWHVVVLHTPGHSPGSIAVYDPRSRAAAIGDAVLWNTLLTREGTAAFPPTYRSVDSYLATLQRLQGMAVDLLLTSHYPVARGPRVADFLSESRAFADAVDAALRQALQAAEAPPTLRQLTQALGPRLGTWPEAATVYLAYPFLGHLERLQQLGLVETTRRGGLVAWRWKGARA